MPKKAMLEIDQNLPMIAPHYESLKELGVGGMGRVLLAWDNRLERHVAIKLLHRTDNAVQASERFLHEARAVAKLSHPNIVGIYDVGEVDGWYYMVMEYLQGRSLEQMIADVPRIPISLCAAVGVQICAALDYTHQHGIIHRDIKPANILLARNGVAKLTDFGIVKHSSSGLAALEEPGAAVGTLKYASPEQLLDANQVGPGSDLYSLAVTLFEMLTGEHPYESPSASDFVRKVFHAKPPALRDIYWDIPAEFETVLLKSMGRDPGERFNRAAEMGESLAGLIDNNSLQRILAGPLFNMRNLVVDTRPAPAKEPIGSTHTDLRLVPDSRRLLVSLRQDLSWVTQLCQNWQMRESQNLPKSGFLERVLTSGFSGLIQINDSVWALVQNGYFLEFISQRLTPSIDKTGDEIFHILPSKLDSVRLYPASVEQIYLPLLLTNLLQEGGKSTADDSEIRDLSAWPELLQKLPDLTGCLICKNTEMLYCLGYSRGKQIFSMELHPGKACLTDISLEHILGRSHTLWDFYQAEVSLSSLNQTVLLGSASGHLSYLQPQPTLADLNLSEENPGFVQQLPDNLALSYTFSLKKPDTKILDKQVSAEQLVRTSRLHHFIQFWLSELLPLLHQTGQQSRFRPFIQSALALDSWCCYQVHQVADRKIKLDLCVMDVQGQVRMCLRQGEGDSAGVQTFLNDLSDLAQLPDFFALDAAILLAPGAFTLDALALYARSVSPRSHQGQTVPGIPSQAKGEGYQLCLMEYAQHEKLFKLVGPSIYG